MIPEYYEFQNSVKVLSGKNALENIVFELKNMDSKRPAILTGKKLHILGVVELVTANFAENEIAVCLVYDDIPADSSLTVVNDAAKAFRDNSCDSIIAIGGGSVLDTAKGVALNISQNTNDIKSLMGSEIITRKGHVPFIAVPTTSGTGSEATLVAVVADPGENMKLEFLSYNLLPDVAVLDIRMTGSLPAKATASTGIDALCHAIEAYTCLQKNPLSDAYAVAAIELIRDNLLAVVQNPNNAEARLAMANAALIAGVSFSNSMVGLVHAIAHACGGVCHVPHGDAIAVLLPHCMSYNLDVCAVSYGKLLPWICGEVVYTSTAPQDRGARVVAEAYNLTDRLNELCGLPLTLSECGVTEDSLELIARTAQGDGAILMNPKNAGFDEIMEILRKAL